MDISAGTRVMLTKYAEKMHKRGDRRLEGGGALTV
jgi:hypothetical protein